MKKLILGLSVAQALVCVQIRTASAECWTEQPSGECSTCVEQPCDSWSVYNQGPCYCLPYGEYCPPCPACDCFLAGTPVETEHGAKAIEEVRVGDTVIGLSSDGVISRSTVVDVYQLWRWQYIVINKSIKATDAQPFWARHKDVVVTSGEFGDLVGTWRDADELQVGDALLGVDGTWTTVWSIERIDTPVRVYNIEVDGSNVFFAHGYLVHNKDKCVEF